MISSYICRQCRVRLRNSITLPKNPQWQPRATFISLRSTNATPRPTPEQTQPTQSAQPSPASHTEGELHGDSPTRHQPGLELSGRYSRQGLGNASPSTASHELGRIDPAHPTASSSTAPTSPAHAQAISECLDNRNVHDAWNMFLREFSSRDSPAFTNPSPDDIPLLYESSVFSRLLNSATLQFCNGSLENIKPTEIIFKYEQLGIANAKMWANATGYMTDQLLWMVSGGSKSRQTSEALLSELISLWRVFFQCRGTARDPLESMNPDWRSIPDVQSFTQPFNDSHFGRRLQRYHPKAEVHPSLQFSAITIFNLFDEVNQSIFEVPQVLREHASPFINLLTYLLAHANVDNALRHVTVSPPLRSIPSEFRTTLVEQITSAPQHAMRIIGSRPQPAKASVETAPDQASSVEDTDVNREAFYLKRITRAIESQSHAGTLQRLWDEVKGAYKYHDNIEIPPAIYNMFLSGFMQLFKPDKTAEIWNFMIARGVKPDLRTWNAMLNGCVKARDLDGLNGIWDRMRRSGVEPDIYAWTTRIHGLITLKHINLGFAAMDEVGKGWIASQSPLQNTHAQKKGGIKTSRRTLPKAKTGNEPAKPTVELINSAMSALTSIPDQELRHNRKVEYVQKILRWSGAFSIAPDIITYNIMISMYLRANDHATAFNLLRQMTKNGVQSDLSTHTMLLNAAFNSNKFDGLSEAEQTDRVIQMFDDLEADGLKLNAFICSSAIDRLLKLYGNISAVTAIMNYMASRSIPISAQINTSVITHYFQQTPPDIASIDSLVARIFGPAGLPADKYLFDRLIEGYAENHEIGKMMSVLTRMSSHGKLPGWPALTAVVRALAQAEDWDRAREVVRDVQLGRGVAQGGVTGSQRHRDFFVRLVKSLGHGLTESLAGDFLEAPMAQHGHGEDGAGNTHIRTETNSVPGISTERLHSHNEKLESGDFIWRNAAPHSN
ncbi:unnamed protein product [Periconia digitata]|uniref:Pentatricopeptide repeat-containing protein n=1 Tax=Periconia digitata TaxID=1303443 RepID=A0A9W4XLZ4_9PLEO|nr:unnamed protein product [Periconia digitata]